MMLARPRQLAAYFEIKTAPRKLKPFILMIFFEVSLYALVHQHVAIELVDIEFAVKDALLELNRKRLNVGVLTHVSFEQ